MKSTLIGRWGEEQTAEHYRKKGYVLIDCNYRSRYGEIDLIVQKKAELVFVEVKLRRSDRFASPFEHVDRAKIERLRKTALLWLAARSLPADAALRFDVASVYAPEGISKSPPRIDIIENAF